MLTLSDVFERQARATPHAAALEWTDALGVSQTLTYEALNRRADRLAQRLLSAGAGCDVAVGIATGRSPHLALAVLATIKAGAAYLPLDPAYPHDRLALMIEDSRAPIVLGPRGLLEQIPTGSARLLEMEEDRDDEPSAKAVKASADPHALAYIIYTSGSTGRPKGVAMPQVPLLNLLQWQKEYWPGIAAARTLQFTSLNFDVSFQELFATWHSGGTLVLISEEERRDPTRLVRFLAERRIQRLFLPFVALRQLAEAAEREEIYPEHLRHVVTAGEQLQITPALRRFFSRLPGCALENQYGPSETHVVTSFMLPPNPESWPVLPPIGKPIANVEVRILNGDLQPVRNGDAGEIFLGGVCLARGYLNRPELTEERFVADPERGGERLYRTGDLGRWLPDGNIEFLGRADQQVKIRGFRVELGEVEAALSAAPSVREAAVTLRNTPSGDKQLVAYVVSRDGPVDPRSLRQFLLQRVPEHAVPGLFVPLPQLPQTPSGKVDRRALPDPAEVTGPPGSPIKMPRSPLEMQVKLVFEKMLQQRPLSTDASFFEIGGDSLQALRLIVEIERVTGHKLPLEVLYRAPSVEALCRVIEDRKPVGFSCLVPLQPVGTRPPLFLVHTTPGDVLGYGNLIFHLDPEQPTYAFQSQGLYRAELCHRTIEDMASHYVRLMRMQQPRGPYHLGGWCYGGIIAVEMAQQLRVAGAEVAPLLLIETPAPDPSMRHLYYYVRRLGCLLRMTGGEWQTYLRAKFQYYRGARRAAEMRFKRAKPEKAPEPAAVEEHNRLLEKLERVYNANTLALTRYRPRRYPGKIILFNAAEPDPALIRDPLYGWPGLADDIERHVVPGNHDTILMEPHVKVLARKMEQCLRAAQNPLSVRSHEQRRSHEKHLA